MTKHQFLKFTPINEPLSFEPLTKGYVNAAHVAFYDAANKLVVLVDGSKMPGTLEEVAAHDENILARISRENPNVETTITPAQAGQRALVFERYAKADNTFHYDQHDIVGWRVVANDDMAAPEPVMPGFNGNPRSCDIFVISTNGAIFNLKTGESYISVAEVIEQQRLSLASQNFEKVENINLVQRAGFAPETHRETSITLGLNLSSGDKLSVVETPVVTEAKAPEPKAPEAKPEATVRRIDPLAGAKRPRKTQVAAIAELNKPLSDGLVF